MEKRDEEKIRIWKKIEKFFDETTSFFCRIFMGLFITFTFILTALNFIKLYELTFAIRILIIIAKVFMFVFTMIILCGFILLGVKLINKIIPRKIERKKEGRKKFIEDLTDEINERKKNGRR